MVGAREAFGRSFISLIVSPTANDKSRKEKGGKRRCWKFLASKATAYQDWAARSAENNIQGLRE